MWTAKAKMIHVEIRVNQKASKVDQKPSVDGTYKVEFFLTGNSVTSPQLTIDNSNSVTNSYYISKKRKKP